MSWPTRRQFLQVSGAAAMVGVTRSASAAPSSSGRASGPETDGSLEVNFWGDGIMPTPAEHAAALSRLTRDKSDLRDRYGVGGAVERLEQEFARLTGKERALYLPSGTMANQLAIRVLCGDASKVLVQDLSHVYRDEADAAQVVHGKRLVPLAQRRATFTAEDLENAVRRVSRGEAFPTRIGAVSIENPVRRAEGQGFPIDELRDVCAAARAHGLALHLDGARLLLASAYSGVPVAEYADLFDTVYISLYKYLGAPAGAVLCGSHSTLDSVALLRKRHGGDMYQNWPYAAVALDSLGTFADRFERARAKAVGLFEALEGTGRFELQSLPSGTNVFRLGIGAADAEQFRDRLREGWNIRVREPGPDGLIRLYVNETQMRQGNDRLVEAFEDAHRAAS